MNSGGISVKIGLAQMHISFENKDINKQKCLQFLDEAHKKAVELIIFPEMTLTGFSMNVDKINEMDNGTINWFKTQAEKYNIIIGFGYVKKENSNGRNMFSIVSPTGEELLRYTKIHPFSFSEEDRFYDGGTEITFASISDFVISSFICYDLRFPEIFQLASSTAAIITLAANWPKSRREHWITLLKARAIENQCYIAGVNAVGRINDIDYSGDSMIINPMGEIIAEIRNEEGLLIADIDLNEVIKLRSSFPLKQDRKESLYKTFMD